MKPWPTCSRPGCPEAPAPSHRYCRAHKAEYMREWRRTHPLSEEERRKDNCRSYTHTLIKRGKIAREGCRDCGAEPAQAHHPDYSNPYLVVWLCPPHHRAEHVRLADAARGWSSA